MTFVKDKSYQNMPFSSETPRIYHSYLSVRELKEKVKSNYGYAFRCRALGILTSDFGMHMLHEIDDNDMHIRVALTHLSHPPPFTGTAYAAQVFGFLIWEENVGPVLYANVVKQMPAYLALRLRDTLRWVANNHYAYFEEVDE